jgi:CBS domain-containing protein
MEKLRVKDLLAEKGNKVCAVAPDATVYEALEIMAEHDIGAVMVIDQANKFHGIFSERDYARRDMIKGREAGVTRVREVMTSRVVVVRSDTSIHDCMALMIEKNVRHLPVLENGEVVGVVSMRDVVKEYIRQQEHVISQQSFHIHELEEYMSGRPG